MTESFKITDCYQSHGPGMKGVELTLISRTKDNKDLRQTVLFYNTNFGIDVNKDIIGKTLTISID